MNSADKGASHVTSPYIPPAPPAEAPPSARTDTPRGSRSGGEAATGEGKVCCYPRLFESLFLFHYNTSHHMPVGSDSGREIPRPQNTSAPLLIKDERCGHQNGISPHFLFFFKSLNGLQGNNKSISRFTNTVPRTGGINPPHAAGNKERINKEGM